MSEVAEKTGRKSRAEWVELMAAYEAGDLSQREFCKRHGTAYSSFGYWRKRLCSPAVLSGSTAEPLLELSLGDATQWRVELDLGAGVMLRLR